MPIIFLKRVFEVVDAFNALNKAEQEEFMNIKGLQKTRVMSADEQRAFIDHNL